MKYWPQEKSTNDCGPCCVAMLTGEPREAVDDVFKELRAREEDGTTKQKHIEEVLQYLDFFMGNMKRVGLRRPDFESRDYNCLLRTRKTNDGNWHWMVWDAAGRQVLDPMRPNRQRFPGNLRGYYEVHKK